MPSLSPTLYARWRTEQVEPPACHETKADALPEERLLQRIWLHQRVRREALRTLDGQPLTILHPGFWNREAGPDFTGAIVQIDGARPHVGDVEIDLRPENWRQHGHSGNPAYRGVVLHAVWEASGIGTSQIPTMQLKGVLDAPLHELACWFGGDQPTQPPPGLVGRCAAGLAALTPRARLGLLAQAARVRLELKGIQLEARARQAGWGQALIEGLLGALGYKRNVWPMRRLGELVPRLGTSGHKLESNVLTLQARLLGLAGLLPEEFPHEKNDPDGYIRSLWDIWWRERDAFSEFILPRAAWRFDGLRPANRPERRLALAAHWLADSDWSQRLEDWLRAEGDPNHAAGQLLQLLQAGRDPFWEWHWTLRSRRLSVAQPLLGAPRTADLTMNVILPWFHARARAGGNQATGERIEALYSKWPVAQENSVLRLARQRFFAGAGEPSRRTASIQQGLLQVVRDFCDRSNALCEGCAFPERLAALAAPGGRE